MGQPGGRDREGSREAEQVGSPSRQPEGASWRAQIGRTLVRLTCSSNFSSQPLARYAGLWTCTAFAFFEVHMNCVSSIFIIAKRRCRIALLTIAKERVKYQLV